MEPTELLVQFDNFIREASRLRDLHRDRGSIKLLIGLETELIDPTITFDLLDQVILRHQDSLDYLVGSVHHVNQIPIDFDLATFNRALLSFGTIDDQTSIYKLCHSYFDAQHQLIDRYRPEVIGHFDLCLLFHPQLSLESNKELWDKVIANISLANSYGALFEVNSAALRKGWSTPYPSEPILKLILRMGGKLTLSDDSHGPDRVGLNYDEVLKYLRIHQVNQIWTLEPTRKGNLGLLPRKRVKTSIVPGKWWEHSFWS